MQVPSDSAHTAHAAAEVKQTLPTRRHHCSSHVDSVTTRTVTVVTHFVMGATASSAAVQEQGADSKVSTTATKHSAATAFAVCYGCFSQRTSHLSAFWRQGSGSPTSMGPSRACGMHPVCIAVPCSLITRHKLYDVSCSPHGGEFTCVVHLLLICTSVNLCEVRICRLEPVCSICCQRDP
jgi:hypothetical protein